MKITIDHHRIEAIEGMTVMEAAAAAGIVIPAMCHIAGVHNHPSCMVCLVMSRRLTTAFPSLPLLLILWSIGDRLSLFGVLWLQLLKLKSLFFFTSFEHFFFFLTVGV